MESWLSSSLLAAVRATSTQFLFRLIIVLPQPGLSVLINCHRDYIGIMPESDVAINASDQMFSKSQCSKHGDL